MCKDTSSSSAINNSENTWIYIVIVVLSVIISGSLYYLANHKIREIGGIVPLLALLYIVVIYFIPQRCELFFVVVPKI